MASESQNNEKKFSQRLILELCIDFIYGRTSIWVYFLFSECHSWHFWPLAKFVDLKCWQHVIKSYFGSLFPFVTFRLLNFHFLIRSHTSSTPMIYLGLSQPDDIVFTLSSKPAFSVLCHNSLSHTLLLRKCLVLWIFLLKIGLCLS